MTNGDTVRINACEYDGGFIYDDGGSNNNYSNNFQGWVVITAQPGVSITLSGNYTTESSTYDWIDVWDGDVNTGIQLVTRVGGTGTINETALSGTMTIYFRTDGSATYSGFALQWSHSTLSGLCTSNITSLVASDITSTSATLSWTSDASSLILDYGSGLTTVTGSTTTLTGLNPNTLYTVRLYAEGDVASPCCVARTSFRTNCGVMEVPIVESFDDYGYGSTVFPTCWTLITNIDGTPPANITNQVYSTTPASLRISTTETGYYSLAIMPEITGTNINQLMLRLKVRSASSGTKLEVGVCSGTELFNNYFTAVDTLTISTANEWTEYVVSFSSYTNDGVYPALRMHGNLQTSNNRSVYIDEVRVESCGVWHQSLLKRNAHDIWMQWEEYGDPTVNVEYGPVGFVAGSGINITNTSSPLHVSGLDAATSYEFRFYTECGNGAVSNSYRSITLSTLEGPRNDLNLCENFEAGGIVPSGWRRHNTYDGTPTTSTNYRHSGSRALLMRPNRTTTMPIVVLPMIDTVQISSLNVSFWAYSDGYTTGRIVMGTMEYPEVAEDFVPFDTIYLDAGSVWRRYQVNMAGYTGNGKYLALQVFDPNTSYNRIYIDDMEVGTCILNGVYVTNIGAHKVELRWDTVDAINYHGDSVIVEYGGTGFIEGTGTRISIAVRGSEVSTSGNKQRIEITGLEPDSAYTFIVYSQCDTMVQACNKAYLNAHTLEQDLTLPYCTDFEGVPHGSIPSGWTRTSVYGSEPCVHTDQVAYNGVASLELYSNGDLSRNHSVATLPMFDVDSLQGLTLSFKAYTTYNNTRYLQIGVMDNPNDESSFVPVTSITPSYNQWSSHIIHLSNYTGTGKYIAFRWYFNNCNGCNYPCYIDALIVSDAATANSSVNSVTSHGATFTWSGVGRSYNGACVEWGPAGFTFGSGTKDTVDANTFSLTIDTLQMGTAYDCFITAISSEAENNCNYTRQSFNTFDQPTAASFCYGFEDIATYGYPVGWTRPQMYSSTPRIENIAHEGNRSLRLYSYNCSTPYASLAVMPYLEEVDLSGLTLRFWANGWSDNNVAKLLVGMMSDPNDATTFDTIATLTINHSGEWRQYSVDLGQYSGTGRHLAFWHVTPYSCRSGETYIDDITINRCRVSRVRAYSETTSTVKIDWDTLGSIDSVQVEYGLQGFAPGSGTFITTTDTVVTLTELPQAGVYYDYYLRPYCTGSTQVCSESKYSFSTTMWRVGDGWCEDFESHDGNGSTPWWWRRPVMWDYHPEIWTHGSNSGYYTSYQSAFEFRATNATCNIAVMPTSVDPLSELIVSFNLRCTESLHPERASLIVGAMPNPYDTAAFVAIDTLHPTFLYQRRDISLASYPGSYRHIAFKYLDNDGRYTYIDDLTLSRCRPTQIQTTAITNQSVNLSWHRMGYNDTTLIVYGLVGQPFANGTRLRTVETSITIDGLLSDTNYWFYLYGKCADSALECQALRHYVRTLAEPMTAPICYNFDNDALFDGLPTGWVRPYGNTEACVTTDLNETAGGRRSLHLYTCSYGNDNDRTNMVVMPALQVDDLSGLWLELGTYFDNGALLLEIGVMYDPYDTSTFTPIDTLSGNTWWSLHFIDLSQYSGPGRCLAFRSLSNYYNGGNIYIDDINIRTCTLTSAYAGMPTLTTLTLTWSGTEGTTGAWVEYAQVGGSTENFEPGSGDTLYLNSSTLTIDSLAEATWYAFHFYPDCGNGSDGCNYAVARAQTLHPRIEVPYCESFDLYAPGNYLNNWRRLSTYNGNYPQIDASYRRSPNNSLVYIADGTLHSLAVMPGLLVDALCSEQVDSLFANFWTFFTSNWENAAMVVGVVTDANNAASFVPTDTIRASAYGTWEHHTVTIRDFSSSNTFVAYKFISLNGSYSVCYMDDLCMEKCVASNVTVSNITQNSATVTWTSYGVDSLMCEYGPQGFTPGTGIQVALYHSPAVISGLQDGTQYQFTFSSVCNCNQYGSTYHPGGGSGGGNGGGSHHYVTDTVTTQASFLHIPYCEGFEGESGIDWYRSWRRIGGLTPGYPALTDKNHHSGEHCMVFYTPVGSSNHAALPPLEPGIASNLVMSFFAYATNGNAMGTNARFIVGVMTDPDNASTFVPIDTIRLTSTSRWEQHVVDFSSYSGNGQYIAFRFAPYNAQYYYYIDDIYLGTCAVSNIGLSSTSSSVTLSWTDWHTPSHVLVEYGPQGFSPGGTTSLGTMYYTTSPALLTGISPDSNYDFYVTALCDDTATTSCFTSPVTLNPKLYTPYCEDFEDIPNDARPDSWRIIQGRDVYPRTETSDNQQVMAFYPCTGIDNIVLLPDLPDDDSLEGKWVYAYFSTSDNNYIYLDFGFLSDTTNASTFVQMATMSNGSNNTYKEFNSQLHYDGASGKHFAIRARSTSGCRQLFLSKLVYANYPYPTGLTNTALGVAKQRIHWSGQYNNPYYGIEYGYDDHWQTIASSDSCTALLTDLQPGQTYQVFFISPDGERFCLPYTFTTDEYVEIPYCNSLYASSWLEGWSRYHSYNYYNISDRYPRPDSWDGQGLYFYCHRNYSCYAVMPDIDIDSLKHADIRFEMRADGSQYVGIIVGVISSKNNYSTFVPVDTLRNTAYSTWQPVHTSLSRYSGDGRYLTFRQLNTDGSWRHVKMRNLTISTCPLPDFSVAGARQVKATLPTGASADYWVEYGTGNFVQGQKDTVWNADSTDYTLEPHGTVVHVTENPYYITGLEPNTLYSFYARCDEQDSTCAAPTLLTTAQERSLPYCDNFDNYPSGSYQRPSGWYGYSSHDNSYYPYIYNYSGYASSCCQSFYFYSHRNYLQFASMPDIAVDSIRHLELYFNLRVNNNNYVKLVVGVMQQQNDYNTFTPVDTVGCTTSGSYQPQHVSMARYSGNGRFIAFRILITDGSWRDLYVDDLRINTYPTPQITLANANTVRIIRGDQRNLWIEMTPHDTVQGADTNRWFNITQDTFNITNLDYLTTYDFYHHADSGEVSCFPRTQITTSTLLPIPFCDNFNSYPNYTMPTDWVRVCANSNSADYPRKHYNGYLQFYNYCYSNSRSYAIMPELDIDSLRHAELYLNVQNDNSNNYLIVGVMTNRNDIHTFIAVDTIRPSGTGYFVAMHASLQRYQGDGRFIAFCFVNTNGNCSSLYIDDLYIQACPRPSIQLVGGTTVVSIVDTHYAADYWLEYGPQGITPGAVDTVWNTDSSAYCLAAHNTLLHVTADTLLLSGLAANTTYDFYARCDSAHASCYPRTAQITTSRVQSIPYCEEFNSYGSGSSAYPTGWRRYISNNNNSYLYVYNDNDASDHRSLRFNVTNSYYAYAVLPEMEMDDLNNITLRVTQWSHTGSNVAEQFIEVGVMTNMNNISTFQVVDTLQNTTSGCWQELSASLANYNGTGRFIALRMRNTTGNWRNIYIDRLQVLTCDIPANVSAILHSHNQVRIDADDQSRTGFWVEYGTAGFEQGNGTFVHIDHLPTVLTLNNSTSYDFYFRCDTLTQTCLPVQTVSTLPAPTAVPYCENFDSYANNALPTHWKRLNMDNNSSILVTTNQHHSGTKSLRMGSYNQRTIYAVLPDFEVDSIQDLTMSLWVKGDNRAQVTVGVMSDPNDAGSFMAIKQIGCPADWTRYLVSFASAPDEGRFIALRYTSSYYYYPYAYIDDLFLSTCGATGMHLTSVEADHVVFDWEQTGAPHITIEYGATGFTRGSGDSVVVSTPPPYTLQGLNNLTNYQFFFDAVCDDGTSWCSTNYSDSATVFTPSGGTGCIDPTNLTADYTTCFYGTYGNPYSNIGVVDSGRFSIGSRHTVHYDPDETDPRTGGALHTVPAGAQASVRLGNWGVGAQAEAVTYSLAVDTTQFDLLILKYAAVLQDNDHPSVAQPRFTMELLDTNGILLDTCSAADFIANQNLGWNLADDFVLWKDWTTVGVDVTRFHGQVVRVRLTIYDCSDGGHFGYAYFTLSCQMKNLISDHCGEVAENRFTAPDGFNYNWYTNLSDTTFSTNRTITVPTNNNVTYYCQLAFVDNPACHFTMSAFAGTRWPLSLFDSTIVISDCQFSVTFGNHSTISMDGVTPVGTGESVETASWDFGNGTTSTTFNPTVTYDTAGTYTVQLISTIAGGACVDTLEKEITLAFPSTSPHIEGATDRCFGAPADTLWLHEASQWTVWSDTIVTVSPIADTTYTLVVTDSNGCTHTVQHSIAVHPSYNTTLSNVLCDGDSVLLGNTTITTGGTYYDSSLTAVYLCDSITTLQLTVHSHTDSTIADTINEFQLPWTFLDTTFSENTQGVTFVIPNAAGCDSTITYSLNIVYNPKRHEYDTTVCESALPCIWQGHTLDSACADSVVLTAAHGEDSTVVLNLLVIATSYDTVYATICDNQSYPFEDDSIYTLQGAYTHTLTTSAGCDSLRTLRLTVNATTTGDTTVNVCDHFTWYDSTYTLSTSSPTHISTNAEGCDSTTTLLLTIRHSTDTTISETLVENLLPYTFNGVVFNNDTLNAAVTITNAAGCDSVITYSLSIHWNEATNIDSTVCASALPLTWNNVTFSAAGIQNDTLSDVYGADSVIHMTLYVNPTYDDTVSISICDNQSHTFEDSLYSLAGTYSHLLHTTAGCDSLRTLRLTVNATTTGDTTVNVCDHFTWYDSTYTHSTSSPTHLDTNAAGCDSTTTLLLTIRHSTTGVYYDTVVQNFLPYTYHDSIFADSISHTSVVFANTALCDSVVDYSLFVYWNEDTTLYDTVCASQLPYLWDTLSIDTSLTASATLRREISYLNRYGADSTVVLLLTVHPLYDHHTYDTICDNQSRLFGTHTFLGSLGDTVHLDSLLSLYGCDSLSSLHLTVHPTFAHHLYDTVCSNTSYSWGSPQRIMLSPVSLGSSTSGLYPTDTSFTDNLASVYSCDSLSSLHLHLLAAYDLHRYDTVCQGDSVSFENNVYDTTGTFPFQFSTIATHCDSLRTLHLTVNPVYDIHIFDSIFDGDRYPFEGIYYDTTGVFDTLLTTLAGCDSLRTLHLQCNPRTPHDSIVCQNALPVIWNDILFYEQGSYDSYGTLRGTGVRTANATVVTDSVRLVGHSGIDSLVVMIVTILDTASTTEHLVACDSLLWQDSLTYHLSTSAPYRVLTTLAGCDSVVHLDLTIHNTHYYVDRQHACDSLLWLDQQWYFRDTVAIVGPLGSGSFQGPVDTLATVDGCDSVVALHLTVHHATYEEALDTFCYNQPYLWRQQLVPAADQTTEYTTIDYYLTDTLLTVWNCDSVLAINLTRMGKPLLRLGFDIDCERQLYNLSADVTLDWGRSTAQPPYIRWSSYPVDNHLADDDEGANVTAMPTASPTIYYAYADYHETPLCPVPKDLRLNPIVVPQAQINVLPEALSYDHLSFDAYDVTHPSPHSVSPDSLQVWQRRWYIDGALQDNTTNHLSWGVPMADVDSVVVALSLYNGQCYDTAVRVVPMLRRAFFTPNVFTPAEETNNVFHIIAQGIITGELFIYRRDGQLVYRTADYTEGWDGHDLSGRLCDQGNYIWKLHFRAIDYPDVWRTEVGAILLLK